MHITGGCYCKALRYEIDGEPIFRGLCHCRECQYISGGMANIAMAFPEPVFKYTKGTPKIFRRKDLPDPVTREFCGECGTPILSKISRAAGLVILKVGSLDDATVFEKPQHSIWMSEAHPWHLVQEGVVQFPGFPPPQQ